MDPWTTTAECADADPPLATFFLDRLASLARRRDSALDARQRVALARCTFSVFLDCHDLGLGAEATAILAHSDAASRRVGESL